MTILRIDHTAIAVRDLAEALNRYARIFGLQSVGRTEVPDQGVEIAFLRAGDTQLELICPLDQESSVSRFLDRYGERLHHVGLLVDDMDRELERLRRAGVELIDNSPRNGPHGRIAFVHPRGTGGPLIELIEHTDNRAEASG